MGQPTERGAPAPCRNIEIKARVADLAPVRARAAALADAPPQLLEQEDVFFAAPQGRLKLRAYGDGRPAELIHYLRADTAAARRSAYRIFRTGAPGELRALLADALGQTVIVRKRRELYMVAQTRVHLDRVEGLGEFVELEAVLRPDPREVEGEAEVQALLRQLGLSQVELEPRAYADLLAEAAASRR